jgi:tryptophan synthase alpha chain
MTVARIQQCFERARAENRAVLVSFQIVGDPNVEDSLACALAALEAGSDLLELAVPFSDPTADGPVIARASYHAIKHGGSLRAALGVAEALRARVAAPIVLFTYYNPVLAYGEQELIREATRVGIDGLLIVDLPPEEGKTLRDAADAAELAVIPLLAPTSGPEREASALARAKGFVYYVSLTGVTGAAEAPLEEAGQRAAGLSARSGLPVVVGFGIDSAEKAKSVVAQGVDGVVVGTAIVKAIAGADNTAGRVKAVRELIANLKRGLGR